MNFKYFIAGIYLTFVALIVMMVVKSCHQKVELQTQNYYNEELKFQEQIDAKLAGNAYKDSFVVTESNNQLVILKPVNLRADSIILKFMKADDAASDKTIKVNGVNLQPIDKKEFKTRGVYDLSIRLYQSGVPMLVEKKIKL